MKQKASELLKKDIGALLLKHSEAVTKNDIGTAINIMKDIDFSLAQLNKLDDIQIETKDFKDDNSFLDWYIVLKFFIDSKQSQLIKLDYTNRVNETKHRATGKTFTLVKLSSDLRIPIFTDRNRASFLRDREKELGVNAIITDDLRILNSPQYKKTGIVLVDEMTDTDKINTENFIIIGFTNNHI